MLSAGTKKISALAAVTVALIIALLVRLFSGGIDGSARAQFLRFVPADATSVVFIDLDELRSSPFLSSLYSWAPRTAADSDYAKFVRDTGFDYERDLHKAFIAVSNHGDTSGVLLLAEGKFDRAKIEAVLSRSGQATQQGSLKVFRVSDTPGYKAFSFAFLSNTRVAISDSENLFATLAAAVREAGRAEWQTRFDRLAGTPLFAVIRQDSSIQSALGQRSPQLANLIAALPWISVAAKPDGELLRLVAEGECTSNSAASQLHDFLQGIQVLAQTGLNDPKLRQRMDPQERDAYLELLRSADIAKIDRGESKSVRLVLDITPKLLEVAKLYQNNALPVPSTVSGPSAVQKPAAQTARPGRRK